MCKPEYVCRAEVLLWIEQVAVGLAVWWDLGQNTQFGDLDHSILTPDALW
jgi:hypothetical protein